MNLKNFRTARLRAKGQVTIPKSIRTLLDVDTGDTLIWSIEKGRIVISKAITVFPNKTEP